MPYTFSSPADFADFVKTHDICLVSKDGTKKRSVRTFQKATIDTVGDYLLLMTPFDTIDEKVSNLQAHRKNSSNGQERATNAGHCLVRAGEEGVWTVDSGLRGRKHNLQRQERRETGA